MIIQCMVSNDKSIDDPQKGHIIKYKDLETDVDKAIIKSSPELFKNKTPKECKYIQKIAEDRLSKLEIKINAIIFIAAVAVSFVVPFITIEKGKIGFLVGVIIIIPALFLEYFYWKPKDEACRRIILDAEQRLPEGSVESKQKQEINNITSNTQENPISIEYIKAQLDLLKLIMAGFLGGMLVLSNSILQTNMTDIKYQVIILSVLFLSMIKLMTDYKNYSKRLNKK